MITSLQNAGEGDGFAEDLDGFAIVLFIDEGRVTEIGRDQADGVIG